VGSDPEQLAAILRELARLDPVEFGLAVVLERIVQAAATGCDSTGGVGLLLLGADGQLRCVVAAGRPRRLLAGTQVRLAEGPSVDAFLQAAPVSSSDLAAEPRWPDSRLLALAAGIRAQLSVPVSQRHGPIGALDSAHADPRPWQAHEAGYLVGGGLDLGDRGSPQPLEPGAHARPVASSDRAGRREQTVEF
jgi:GAF domain-containing protein